MIFFAPGLLAEPLTGTQYLPEHTHTHKRGRIKNGAWKLFLFAKLDFPPLELSPFLAPPPPGIRHRSPRRAVPAQSFVSEIMVPLSMFARICINAFRWKSALATFVLPTPCLPLFCGLTPDLVSVSGTGSGDRLIANGLINGCLSGSGQFRFFCGFSFFSFDDFPTPTIRAPPVIRGT